MKVGQDCRKLRRLSGKEDGGHKAEKNIIITIHFSTKFLSWTWCSKTKRNFLKYSSGNLVYSDDLRKKIAVLSYTN